MSNWGKVLREARKRADLTQEELAAKVPMSASYIRKMETGLLGPPKRKKAEDLAAALSITDPEKRYKFFHTAGVGNNEDMEGLTIVDVDKGQPSGRAQPTTVGVEAFGSGVGLGAILRGNQNFESLVNQIVDVAKLPPEQRALAERLILENARTVCEILAKEQDQQRG